MVEQKPKRRRERRPAKRVVSIRVDGEVLDRVEDYLTRNSGNGFRSRSELLGRLVQRGIATLERLEGKTKC